ncbi:MAG: YwbE family protein [Patescibacteria group bacterium]
MDPKNRENIRVGLEVSVVEKHNQGAEALTRGLIEDILTNSSYHPHGIKVRFSTGEVGRVQIIH